MSQDDRFVLTTILGQEHQRAYPRMALDKFFEIFSAEQILKSKSFDLDADQIRSGIVGGGDDGGVDSFYFFVNRKLVREDTDVSVFKGQQLSIEIMITQSKNTASFGEETLKNLTDFTEHCLRLNADLAKVSKSLYSQQLRDNVNRFHEIYKAALSTRPMLAITYYYASLGEQIDPKVETRKQILLEKVRQYYSTAVCSFEFAGAVQLMEWFYQAPTKTLPMEVSRSIPWTGFGKSHICVVRLRKFYEFISDRGILRGHIFEANVRDYQGDVAVNKEIGSTLASFGTEEFWWLNNGITILASQVTSSGDVFYVTDPLIVNGLQTSHEIHRHFRYSQGDDQRTILVRIIESTDAASVDRIIKATNSQTQIPRVWLHATEDIHRKIETILSSSGLYYDRRKNYYRNQGIPPNKIVTIPYLAQALAAIVLQKPDDARARPTTVAERHYKSMFSEEFPVELYSKVALVLKRVDDFLDGIDRAEKLNVAFYLAMCVVCAVLRSPRPKRPTIATLDLSKITDAMLQEWLDVVVDFYAKMGGDDRAAKGPLMAEALKNYLQDRYGRTPGHPEPRAKRT